MSVHPFPQTRSMRLPGPPPQSVNGDRVERMLAAAVVVTLIAQAALMIAGWLIG